MAEEEEMNEEAQELIDSSNDENEEIEDEEMEDNSEKIQEILRKNKEKEQQQEEETSIKGQVEIAKQIKPEHLKTKEENILESTKVNMLKQEQKEKEQEIKLKRQQAEEKRQEERLKQLQKGPGTGTVLGAQIGGFFGFTREGVAGADITKQKIKSKEGDVQKYEDIISILNKQKNLKIKQAKSDGKITDTEQKDINKLIDKIAGYEKKADVQRSVLSKLKTDQIQEGKFRYMSPAVARKIGIMPSAQTNKKGKTTTKKIKGLTIKKGFDKRFAKSLKGATLAVEPKQQQISTQNEIDISDETEIKPAPVKRNPYGVDDWIMDI